jgi:DNA processing protein
MREQTLSSTHPLLPPTSEDECATWLRLLRSRRVGISTFYRLMREYGSAAAALDALPSIASAAGVANYTVCSVAAVQRELDAARAQGAQMVCIGDPNYPDLLSEIPDAPPILWVRGNLNALTRPTVAMVGARNASSLGTRMARALSQELGEAGLVVVSGLARGIDTCAHLACVSTGTIGVLAGGVDVLYPSENTALAEQMLDTGALISEQPLGMAPIARHFPQRNRLISGMCKATIVVEAAAKSGSLITARGALDQGRDVLAVPGHPFDARASGCNMLLRDGATLVRSAQDVLENLGSYLTPELPLVEGTIAQDPTRLAKPKSAVPEQSDSSAANVNSPQPPKPPAAAKPNSALRQVAALHQRILDRLGPSPISENELLRDLECATKEAVPVLTELELKGSIRRAPGGMVSRS